MPDLIDRLPDYYKNCVQVAALQGAYQVWTDALKAGQEDLMLQLNVETATWGLDMWEDSLGLVTDVSKSYAYRRTRVKSKLRSRGTATKDMIRNVAEAFSNGEVTITEYPEESRFEVKFTGTLGIPPNMDDLTAAIDEIAPAHLEYMYVYTYITWDMHDAYNHTWDEWDSKGLTWDDITVYKE